MDSFHLAVFMISLQGDTMRHLDRDVLGHSANFVWVNRGKESIVVDIKNKLDVALIRRMLAKADIWIQNLGPGSGG
jgi:crotonobetainyl-CoA:carnitine CoA-transferase CaiB-like acyl-CoA transferase